MEFKVISRTEIRKSSSFLSKMTRGFRQKESRGNCINGVKRKKKTNFGGWKQPVAGCSNKVPHHIQKEVGHFRSDSLTVVAMGPQNELSTQTHKSIKTGYCSSYFVLAAVSVLTAGNYHPGGNPAFTVFL